jgi:hypothetical protein
MDTKKKTDDERLSERVKAELENIDMDARYVDMLDECYSFNSVGGPFAHMSPARVLKEVDPVAYRCGFNDWEDSELRDSRDIEEYPEGSGEVYNKTELDKLREEVSDEIEAEEAEAADREAGK